MSKLIDIVANTMKLALADKIEIVENSNYWYSIHSKDQEYLGDLEEYGGYCYFWHYNDYPCDNEAFLSVTLLVIIREFLAANYHLVKLSEIKANDKDYYLITEKVYGD